MTKVPSKGPRVGGPFVVGIIVWVWRKLDWFDGRHRELVESQRGPTQKWRAVFEVWLDPQFGELGLGDESPLEAC